MALAVDRLTRRVKHLHRLAAELQDLAVDVATELEIVRRTLAADASRRIDTVVECGLLRAAQARQRDTLRAAATGARTLEMRAVRGGAAMVRIDEGKWFRLTRADARLLRVLTQSGTVGADGFPAWQGYEHVTEQIGLKSGTPPTRHALTESVYRIRRALKAADLNQYLLQVDRKLGRLRFLLRQGRDGGDGRG